MDCEQLVSYLFLYSEFKTNDVDVSAVFTIHLFSSLQILSLHRVETPLTRFVKIYLKALNVVLKKAFKFGPNFKRMSSRDL